MKNKRGEVSIEIIVCILISCFAIWLLTKIPSAKELRNEETARNKPRCVTTFTTIHTAQDSIKLYRLYPECLDTISYIGR